MSDSQQQPQTGSDGMQALVYHGPNEMEVETIERPSAPGPGDVLVRVKAVGICGSDVHGYTGVSGRRTPGMVMGHELAGVVSEAGPGVQSLRHGDRVTIDPLISCGQCDSCLAGKEQICRQRRTIGVNMGKMGGFSEYVIAPARNCVTIAEEISFGEGLMAEPLAVGLHAVRVAVPEPGEPVLVLGGGTIGLCILVSLLQTSIETVYVTDLLPRKLELIAQIGGKPLDANSTDLAALAKEATGGRGFARIIDAVATSDTIRQAVPALAPGGTLVLVGLARPNVEFALYDLVTQERSFRGSYAFAAAEFREATEWINSRRVDVRPMLQERCALEDAADMFRRKAEGGSDAVKIIVEV